MYGSIFSTLCLTAGIAAMPFMLTPHSGYDRRLSELDAFVRNHCDSIGGTSCQFMDQHMFHEDEEGGMANGQTGPHGCTASHECFDDHACIHSEDDELDLVALESSLREVSAAELRNLLSHHESLSFNRKRNALQLTGCVGQIVLSINLSPSQLEGL